jgi:hypothetical protein
MWQQEEQRGRSIITRRRWLACRLTNQSHSGKVTKQCITIYLTTNHFVCKFTYPPVGIRKKGGGGGG